MGYLPSRNELAVLVVLSLCCTLIVGLVPQRDVGLMCCGAPLTLVAALLGLRRNQLRNELILAEKQQRLAGDE